MEKTLVMMKLPATLDEVDSRLTSTFSTTCLPKEQTLVEQLMIIFLVDSNNAVTP